MTRYRAELVVVGESMAGVVAAVRASREGLDVLIVAHGPLGAEFPSLGALETHYAGVRTPLLSELRGRIVGHYRDTYGAGSPQLRACASLDPDNPMLTFEPRVARRAVTEMVGAEPRIRVLKGLVATSVELARDEIIAVRFVPHEGGASVWVEGEVFVDATNDGDVAALAGVPYRVGREGRLDFHEAHAGRIFTRFVAGRYPIDAAEGRLNILPKWTTLGLLNGSTGEGDDNVQDYSYRLCLSDDPDNRIVPRDPPPGYDRRDFLAIAQTPDEIGTTRYALHHRFLTNALPDMIANDHLFHGHALPNRKRSWNATNFTGAGKAYPDADWPTRQAIARRHLHHALGILFFLQRDEAVPEEVRLRARAWGLARDEFVDSGHVPEHLYVRESRRIVGRTTYTENDGVIAPGIERAPIHADAIGITDFPLDSLPCTTERMPGSLADGQTFLMETSRPGQIPLRVVLPQRLENLVVPLCASVSHVAWGTVRQTPTLMHVAESVGFAVALAREHGVRPGRLSVGALQRRLVERGVMLSFFNDVDMATAAPWVAAVQLLGTRGFFRSYDARPAEPLTVATAARWAETAHHLLRGAAFDPLEAARRLPLDADDARARAIGRVTFEAMLAPCAPVSNGGEPLSRGDACRLVYERWVAEGGSLPS